MLDENKQQLGVMPLADALRVAQSKGLDLVEIAPTATPVCRIVNYDKSVREASKEVRMRVAGLGSPAVSITP